jgi:hypothetical protein
VKRALLLVPVLALVLGACSGSDFDLNPDEAVDPNVVSVEGVSFARPLGFLEIDRDDLSSDLAGNPVASELARSMHLDAAALAQVIETFDLYLAKKPGRRGFADNVSVASPGGAAPGPKELKAQFVESGAKNVRVGKAETDLGQVTTGTYSLRIGKVIAQGEVIVVDADETLFIAVTTNARSRTKRLAKGILETLAED